MKLSIWMAAPLLLLAMPSFAQERKLVRRTITISDASATSISELRVAGGISTTLVFQVPLKENGVILADSSGSFYPPQIIDKIILVIPKASIPKGKPKTLTVTLGDGTVLPFKLISSPDEVDLQVDVAVIVAPDSPQALKASVAQLRSQLDECQASSGTAGISKIASLIASQNLAKPQAFTVERRNLHSIDKQSRLLVEVSHAYRLFGQTYLVVTIQNRDPSKTWVLDRPELGLTAAGQNEEIKVVTFAAELAALPPDEMGKVVIVFNTPEQGVGNKLALSLLEKNGNRHFRFDDLSL